MNSFSSLTLAFTALWLILPSASAQTQPNITVSGRIDLAANNVTGSNAAAVSKVLQNNLQMTGAFNLTTPDQAALIVKAVADSNSVQGTLSQKDGRILLKETFTGGWRKATHLFSDAIVEKITGTPGIATSQVTFVSAHSGSKELYTMDLDGANVRQLTQDKSISLGPKFSKQGNQIVYTSWKSGYPDVWVIDLLNSNRRKVSFYPGVNSGPAFSPNGSQIALTLSKDGNTELYTIAASGGSAERLTRTRGTEASPTWSPDGNTLAYISDDRGSPQLYTISNSLNSAPQRINTSSSYTTEPDWSPDGQKIAYSIQAAGQNQIAFTTLSSGQQTILTSGGANETPSWARNSRHLVFARGGKLHLLDSVTRSTFTLENGLTRNTEPNISR
jgi:TolB protein